MEKSLYTTKYVSFSLFCWSFAFGLSRYVLISNKNSTKHAQSRHSSALTLKRARDPDHSELFWQTLMCVEWFGSSPISTSTDRSTDSVCVWWWGLNTGVSLTCSLLEVELQRLCLQWTWSLPKALWWYHGTRWYFDGTLLNDYSAIYHNTCLKSLHHFGIFPENMVKPLDMSNKKKGITICTFPNQMTYTYKQIPW